MRMDIVPLVSKQLRALKGMRVSDGEICGKKKIFLETICFSFYNSCSNCEKRIIPKELAIIGYFSQSAR